MTSGFKSQMLSNSMASDEKCVTCEYCRVAFSKLMKVENLDFAMATADNVVDLVIT